MSLIKIKTHPTQTHTSLGKALWHKHCDAIDKMGMRHYNVIMDAVIGNQNYNKTMFIGVYCQSCLTTGLPVMASSAVHPVYKGGCQCNRAT